MDLKLVSFTISRTIGAAWKIRDFPDPLDDANRCLNIIRLLGKEIYSQDEVDQLFNTIVLPILLMDKNEAKITQELSACFTDQTLQTPKISL